MAQPKKKQKRTYRTRVLLPIAITAVVSILVGFSLASLLFNYGNSSVDNDEQVSLMFIVVSPVLSATVPPPTITPLYTRESFEVLATRIVETATAAGIISLTQWAQNTLTDTPDSLQVEATGTAQTNIDEAIQTTNIIQIGTAQAVQATEFANNSEADYTQLACNLDGEFDLSINQTTIRDEDTLILQFRIYNSLADFVDIEIFGGILTNDEYKNISSVGGEVGDGNIMANSAITFTTRVSGTDYDNGRYLVGIQLLNAQGETLSNCALPVTFID
ncbi:MAG: hypothetical protein AAF846_14705 [Chloroflexota bacterium]